MDSQAEIIVTKVSLEDCRSQFRLSTVNKNVSVWLSFERQGHTCKVFKGRYIPGEDPFLRVPNDKTPVGIAVAEDDSGNAMLYLETDGNLVEVGSYEGAKRPWTMLELDGFEEVYAVTAKLTDVSQSDGIFGMKSGSFLVYGIVGATIMGIIVVVVLASVLTRKGTKVNMLQGDVLYVLIFYL